MANQIDSPDGRPRKDPGRPSPDVERDAVDGQSGTRGKGLADDVPAGDGGLQFDDEDAARPRGNTARTGGTWQAQGGDSGRLDKAPGAGLSDRNGPSEPGERDGGGDASRTG